ncbi:hypothetical protein [Streptomyces sp. HUCO-GS316]|uniref:hypothetical protein n=1 Tax=Streptomyces sp. HUCO-GS316 TaxID=2692198 RepID=UPI0019259806|nr:hypothetical protein [Streptomyces sp. HUCO-GS316]
MPSPLTVCLARNATRTSDRHVPEDILRAQHQAMVATASSARLRQEGFDYAEFALGIQRLGRLGVLLQRVSDTRRRELGLDGGDGLGHDELLLRRFFGPEIATADAHPQRHRPRRFRGSQRPVHQYPATGHAGANDCNNALNRVTWIVASKGGTVHDVTIGDCVELQHAIGEHQTNGYHGKHLFYALLAGLGVFGPNAPARLKTVMLPGQLTPAALVDRHGITCTAIRDLLVDYLTERAVDVDYTTLEDMARTLAGLFWRDLEKHHPGIDSLRLEADIVTAWRERVRMVRDRHGIPIRPRVNAHTVFSWSARSTKMSPAGPPTNRRTGARGWHPARSATATPTPTTARTVPAARRPWTSAPALCCPHSRPWSKTSSDSSRTPRPVSPPRGRPRLEPRSPLRRARTSSAAPGCPPASTPTTRHRPARGPDRGRGTRVLGLGHRRGPSPHRYAHRGALELTHHSFVAYQLPTTGEIVPMLQVAPSKLDQERLLLVSPELGEVLTAIIHRVRRGQQAMPLVSAYDSLERLWSAPMPFLFSAAAAPRTERSRATTSTPASTTPSPPAG